MSQSKQTVRNSLSQMSKMQIINQKCINLFLRTFSCNYSSFIALWKEIDTCQTPTVECHNCQNLDYMKYLYQSFTMFLVYFKEYFVVLQLYAECSDSWNIQNRLESETDKCQKCNHGGIKCIKPSFNSVYSFACIYSSFIALRKGFCQLSQPK